MAVIPNITGTSQIDVKVRDIDFVSQFGKNWQALMEILGIMRPIRKAPGSQLRAYRATTILQDGNVPEGEVIPFSRSEVTEVNFGELNIEKYAKAVSIEAVNRYGALNAVTRTDESFRNELTATAMGRFYNFLPLGELKSQETTLQAAIAMAIGRVQDKFKKMHLDSTRTVAFVNTLDMWRYLADHPITLQTMFGFQYVRDFLGADLVIISSEIAPGHVYATPLNNINLYYIDPADSEFKALGLNYVTDGITNLIGYWSEPNYSRALGESYALMGFTLFAEYIDAVADIKIATPLTEVTLNKAYMTLAAGTTAALTVNSAPAGSTVVWASSDTDVATVSSGTVTAVAGGRAVISATIVDNGAVIASASCIVDVQAVEGEVRLNKSKASVAVSGTVALKATAYPQNATVTWASSDSTVATVSNGTVTGVKAGTANITATVGDAVATCVVTVA